MKKIVCPSFELRAKNAFRDLTRSHDFADVTLVSEDRRQFKAHKVILSSGSGFFREILGANNAQHAHPLIFLRGVDSVSIDSILKLLYLGEVEMEQKELEKFISLAKELDIVDLQEAGANLVSFEQDIEERDLEERLSKKARMVDHINAEQNIDFEDEGDDDIVLLDDSQNQTKVYRCDACDFVSGRSKSFENHKATSHNTKTFSAATDFPCKECNFSAENMEDLKTHKVQAHGGIPCNHCGKRFAGMAGLRKHIVSDQECSVNCLT